MEETLLTSSIVRAIIQVLRNAMGVGWGAGQRYEGLRFNAIRVSPLRGGGWGSKSLIKSVT